MTGTSAAPGWDGVRDATRFASTCLQAKSEYAKAQEGAEDCIYLNVYVPSGGRNRSAPSGAAAQ